MSIIGLAVSLVISFALCYVFTPFVRGMAVRWRIGDKPNGRTSRDIAHIGGVAIIGAILFALIPLFLFFLPDDPLNRAFAYILIASGFITFLLGIIDDLRSLHFIYKVFFQVTVSVFVAAGGVGLLEHFQLIHLPVPMALLAFGGSAVWMFTIITSFNLIDGVDGLASGITITCMVAFAAAGVLFELPLVVALSVVVFGSALAFLRYNFPPAKILMGDSGSLFFGLLAGLISLLLLISGEKMLFKSIGIIFVLIIPLLDTTLAFLRRLMTNRPVFEADLLHLHHILSYRFKSDRKVDLILWSLSAFFGLIGVFSMIGNIPAMIVGGVLAVCVFILSLREMLSYGFSKEDAERMERGCTVETSRMVPRRD